MEEAVKKENIIVEWVLWHFFEMPKFLFSVWANYIYFALNFFSLTLLFKTLFYPWRKNIWRYPKGLDLFELLNVFVSNIFSRAVGAVCRILLIIIGAIFQIFILIFGFLVILSWLTIPFLIAFGIFLIFSF